MPLQFGLFDTFPADTKNDYALAFERHVADAALIERLGDTYCFIIEHQNARCPVITSPAR